MSRQELRNALSAIEDEARVTRKNAMVKGDYYAKDLANLIVQLTQLVRQEIVE